MFDFVRKHTKWMMGLMFLLIIPAFVLVGVDGYKRINASGPSVAEIGKHAITQADWEAAHKMEVERLRTSVPNLDPKMLDSAEAKYATLERMVRDQVIGQAAEDAHLTTTDARLAAEILKIPGVRKADGSIDRDAYKRFLVQRGYAQPEAFEAALRRDMTLRQVEGGVTGTSFASAAVSDALLKALYQRREIQIARFAPSDYSAKVSLTDADLEAFYHANQALFQVPESASIEYVSLDMDSVKKSVSVNESDVKSYYEQNVSRLSGKEERRASHILVSAPKDAPAEKRQAAKEKAAALLQQVRKAPESFAEVARKNSDDIGSAKAGGDLDFFGRGAMVKPFEDAVFAMKKGDISELVESDFGFHIIRLTDVKAPKPKSFEELRAGIETDLRNQLAQRRYAEVAESFTNGVFEQPDTYKGVAEKLKLEIKTAANVVRNPQPGAAGPLASPKLLEALFAPESLSSKRNTEAVEVGANQLVSARIVQYNAPRVLALAEVKDRVKERLTAVRAAELARKDGEARLALWKDNAKDAKLGNAMVVARDQLQGLEMPVVEAALRAPTQPLPAWTSADLGPKGFVVVRVNAQLPRAEKAQEAAARESAQVAQWLAKSEGDAYFEVLKRRMKVSIKVPNPLEAK
ncbi:SurA N-terminal domain-containing protein [Curvibacter sp. APW13]|uniref:SurA N-terminal domain-containing protein n=1 Tax=Curvibacter sp. APW13 TaxID=3077236 RepID=UPI0028E0467B|nr:SurA N-terminal domain-containing protein [Curvibacter sp. APW13]MDT8992153.1 SurA N-terminal domain-containing protein [Curvibacter sp. APW13]